MNPPSRPVRAFRGSRAISLARLAVVAALAVVTVAGCSVFGSGLTGETWQLSAMTQRIPAWQGVIPKDDQSRYTIEFLDDGTVAVKADCNQVGGTYEATPTNGLTITLGPSTLAMCPEDSIATQFTAGLSQSDSYTVKGAQLTIRLGDGGTMEFVAAK